MSKNITKHVFRSSRKKAVLNSSILSIHTPIYVLKLGGFEYAKRVIIFVNILSLGNVGRMSLKLVLGSGFLFTEVERNSVNYTLSNLHYNSARTSSLRWIPYLESESEQNLLLGFY